MEIAFDFPRHCPRSAEVPQEVGDLLHPGEDVSPDAMALWNECYEVARAFCTVAVEVHLGLDIEQERQLFHDLNRLGKKVETSLALQFDSSNLSTSTSRSG